MPWLDWLRDQLTGGPEAYFPAMLRVRNAVGQVVPMVELDCTYEPSGHRVRKRLVTASGLCMVEWPVRARRVSVELRASEQFARVEIAGRRDNPERVIEVRLS